MVLLTWIVIATLALLSIYLGHVLGNAFVAFFRHAPQNRKTAAVDQRAQPISIDAASVVLIHDSNDVTDQIQFNVDASNRRARQTRLDAVLRDWRVALPSNPGLMSIDDASIALDVVARCNGANVLLFGCAADAPLWVRANPTGLTTVLDHAVDKGIACRRRLESLSANVRHESVVYRTKLRDWQRLRSLGTAELKTALSMSLSEHVRSTTWCAIVVDAPEAYNDETPGRMQSLFAASELMSDGTHVLVHDWNRAAERSFAELLVAPRATLVMSSTKLAHFVHSKS